MSEVIRSFCTKLNVKYTDELIPYYNKGLALFNKKGNYIVDKDRLITLNSKYKIFRKWFNSILEACDAVAKDKDLLLFTYVLAAIIEKNAKPSMIGTPDFGDIATDFAPIFSLLYFLEDMISNLESRKIPFDIISDTLNGFDTEIDSYYKIYGRPGVRTYVPWFLLFVRGEILRVGSFQFQMTTLRDKIKVYKKDDDVKILIDGDFVHKKGMLHGSVNQNDEEGKFFAQITKDDEDIIGYCANEFGECNNVPIRLKGYKEVLSCGDKILSVHIPSDAVLDAKSCNLSYEEAKRIFNKCYPEFNFKAIYCSSWLMEKRLKEIMGKETNITRFADTYYTYPIISDGCDVYEYLFGLQTPGSIDELPENSSMQRAVKKYLAEGKYFYTKSGIII